MAEEKRLERVGIGRRAVLRKAGQLLLAPAAILIAGTVEAAPQGVIVYRLRTCGDGVGRRRCSCNACEKHAQNKYFATPMAAHLNRAHKHCNCAIVQEVVAPGQFRKMFLPGTGQVRLVFDRRW